MNALDQALLLDGAVDQFRLARIQTFNWGTFSDLFDFPIASAGYLFVGPSGSGKSTVLDAHAALLTPPKWVDFNVAAREAERHGRDRSIITYIRGAWAQQTGDSGEQVVQFLRTGTTWSAIAETYRNDQGRCIVLAQVLWVRGNSASSNDARRLYLVLERSFDVRELEFFAKGDFDVRRFKPDLPDAAVYHEFSAYQERFRRLLGIDNERALRLLHKTQSAKNLGDLNIFLRDFMLDAPETFRIADRLVEEFGELNAAHQAVVAAREQIEVLKPARSFHVDLDRLKNDVNALQSLQVSLEPYRESRRRVLLLQRIAGLEVQLETSDQEAKRLAAQTLEEDQSLRNLQKQRLGMGADILEQLQRQLDAAEADKPIRIAKRDRAAAACSSMGWTLPDNVATFVQRVDSARQRVVKATELSAEAEGKKDELKEELRKAREQFQATVEEVRAMERQRSNLPARLVDIRLAITTAIGVAEEKLPFVGELLEVKADAAPWQGAIERVLGGFARALLVEDRYYSAVSAYLNEHSTGERLVYFRMMPHPTGPRIVGAHSLVNKLNVAHGRFSDWLECELRLHFDLECTETLLAFRAASRAVTREGQVKHNASRHEKNDKQPINDRSRWVLGFDNKAKLELYRDSAAHLGKQISTLSDKLQEVREEEEQQRDQLLHCQTLANIAWSEIDVGALLTRISDLTKQIEEEKAARPDLAEMDARIAAQEAKHRTAQKRESDERAQYRVVHRDLQDHSGRLETLMRDYPTADRSPPFKAELDARFDDTKKDISLESLDKVASQVGTALSNEVRAADIEISDLKHDIAGCFEEFNRRWTAESGGLDPVLDSAADYFAKLQRLESDGLPQFESRFLALLQEQSDQNLALLSSKLDQERSSIRARMELVNESLQTAPFGLGTYLVIDTKDKTLEPVRQFRADIKECLRHTLNPGHEDAEQRFATLAALVQRLASQEAEEKHWRAIVLDVRQHVEFVARELDVNGKEMDVYSSGAGKSGGQRQKLAATCLAAALRYQLGGQDRTLPSFSTVVLDEAFDKADSEFTAMAMNIFKTFGFQMVIATPLKSVMTLEPFIGGACCA